MMYCKMRTFIKSKTGLWTINIETNVIIYINVFWYDNDDDICYSVFVFLSGIIRVRRNDG